MKIRRNSQLRIVPLTPFLSFSVFLTILLLVYIYAVVNNIFVSHLFITLPLLWISVILVEIIFFKERHKRQINFGGGGSSSSSGPTTNFGSPQNSVSFGGQDEVYFFFGTIPCFDLITQLTPPFFEFFIFNSNSFGGL